jgi:hypothetical protein
MWEPDRNAVVCVPCLCRTSLLGEEPSRRIFEGRRQSQSLLVNKPFMPAPANMKLGSRKLSFGDVEYRPTASSPSKADADEARVPKTLNGLVEMAIKAPPSTAYPKELDIGERTDPTWPLFFSPKYVGSSHPLAVAVAYPLPSVLRQCAWVWCCTWC